MASLPDPHSWQYKRASSPTGTNDDVDPVLFSSLDIAAIAAMRIAKLALIVERRLMSKALAHLRGAQCHRVKFARFDKTRAWRFAKVL